MQRHPGLQPFSRDHHLALVLAKRLRHAAAAGEAERRDAAGSFLREWRAEIEPHLQREERELRPLLTAAERERLDDEHAELRGLVADLAAGSVAAAAWQRCGDLLHDHVRWEERQLFPRLEADCSEQLQALAESG